MSLTEAEVAVVGLAGDVASAFAALEQTHPSDLQDVVFHVHAIQNIVMARAAQRAHPEHFPNKMPGALHEVRLEPACESLAPTSKLRCQLPVDHGGWHYHNDESGETTWE